MVPPQVPGGPAPGVPPEPLLDPGPLTDEQAARFREAFLAAVATGRPTWITGEHVMATHTDYGQAAYDGYSAHTGGKTHDEQDMPAWADLSERTRGAWAAAAAAVFRFDGERLQLEAQAGFNQATGYTGPT